MAGYAAKQQWSAVGPAEMRSHDIATACGQLQLQTQSATGSPVIDRDIAAKTAKHIIKKNSALFKHLF